MRGSERPHPPAKFPELHFRFAPYAVAENRDKQLHVFEMKSLAALQALHTARGIDTEGFEMFALTRDLRDQPLGVARKATPIEPVVADFPAARSYSIGQPVRKSLRANGLPGNRVRASAASEHFPGQSHVSPEQPRIAREMAGAGDGTQRS